MTSARRIAAEGVGTALLLCAVVGSGIMAERLSGGNAAVALLANAVATGAVLVALILTFGPISGGHFNPIVTAASAAIGADQRVAVVPYISAQVAGAVIGVVAAHVMFEVPWLEASTHVRGGAPQLFSEGLATFGLLSVVAGCGRHRPNATPIAVGLYVLAAYWFTASTSFANPAVTVARAFTDTFTGIRPLDVPGFVAAQMAGGAAAVAFWRWLAPSENGAFR